MALPEVSERYKTANSWLDRYNGYVRRNGPPAREFVEVYFANLARALAAVDDGR